MLSNKYVSALIYLILISTMLSLTISCSSQTEEVIELRLAHFMSARHLQHTDIMVPFAEEVEKATDGRVKITIYPAGALGKPTGQYDAAVTGIADITFGLHGYTPGKFPLVSVMELPFIVDSAEAGSSVLWELYEEFPELKAEHAEVKVLWLWTNDPGQLISNKPIRSMSDLAGLKVRTPSASTKAMVEAWGATPVMMPVTDLYDSLKKGVVDAALMPLSGISSFKLYEISKYVTIGDFYVSTFFMVMNVDSWNRIPEKDRQIMESLIGKQMSEKAGLAYDAGTQNGLEALENAGIEIYSLPQEELAAWRNAAMPLHDKWIADIEAKGLPGEEVYDRAIELAADTDRP